MLSVDNITGALYFNVNECQDQQYLYSKLAQLIDFYHFDQNLDFKRLKVDGMISNKHGNISQTIWIDLVFKKSITDPVKFIVPTRAEILDGNQFDVAANNLLELLDIGNELTTSVS